MQVSLFNNGHEKTKETSKFKIKKVNWDPEKLPEQDEDRVRDSIIFEILLKSYS